VSWHRIFCHLSAEYGWTPGQISELTLDQMYAYLTSAKGVKKMGYAEARDEAAGNKAKREEWSGEMM